MTLLLDTHSFIWFTEGDSRLSSTALQAIENPDNDIYLSIGSLWEISIKNSVGKLFVKRPFEKIIEHIHVNEIEILPITFIHTVAINKLEFHHRDPFDRLIVAQALSEHFIVVGKDSVFDKYGVKRLW